MTDQANALVARQPRVELQAWRDCAAILAITTDEHATQANTDRQVQIAQPRIAGRQRADMGGKRIVRSEEHTSELQSLMRISYAVFCLKKKKPKIQITTV